MTLSDIMQLIMLHTIRTAAIAESWQCVLTFARFESYYKHSKLEKIRYYFFFAVAPRRRM